MSLVGYFSISLFSYVLSYVVLGFVSCVLSECIARVLPFFSLGIYLGRYFFLYICVSSFLHLFRSCGSYVCGSLFMSFVISFVISCIRPFVCS